MMAFRLSRDGLASRRRNAPPPKAKLITPAQRGPGGIQQRFEQENAARMKTWSLLPKAAKSTAQDDRIDLVSRYRCRESRFHVADAGAFCTR